MGYFSNGTEGMMYDDMDTNEMTVADVWEEIWDIYLLGKIGLIDELEKYRKWIPVFDEKLKDHIDGKAKLYEE